MKILVISPHPDDEVLGCGGTMARHSINKDEVYLCIVTKGYEPDWSKSFMEEMKKQIKQSSKILGIKETHFLGYPTVKLDTIPQKDLNKSIFKIIEKIRPDVLYIPHKGDLNKDHRIIFESSLVASRPLKHIVRRILSYEVLSETEWGQPIEPFIPNVYVNISKTFDKKIEAVNAYKSELKKYPHPRSIEIIEALAKKRGSEAGLMLAEAFKLIREIKD